MEAKKSFLMRHGRMLWRCATLLLLAGAAVCAIVNLAVAGGIDWAWYPIVSIAFVWILSSVFFLGGKSRLQYTIGTLALLIFPLLTALDRLTPVHGWARAIGYPVAGASILYIAAVYAVFRYSGWNWMHRFAVVVLGAVPVSLVAELCAARFVRASLPWSSTLNSGACMLAAGALFVLGRRKARLKRASA